MRNIILITFIIFSGFEFAGAQCVISDTGSQFFSPDTLPCIVKGVPYYQIVQIVVPDSEYVYQYGIPYLSALTVDSIVIDSIKGYPTGITDSLNPSNGHILGGAHGCAVVSGTTYDNTGTYTLVYYGTITLTGPPFLPYFSGDTTINMQTLEAYPQDPFHTTLRVINPGDSCNAQTLNTGEKSFSSVLNTAMHVYPNPNNGIFDLDLNTGGRLNGELVIVDITGRKVYSQNLDIMGTYHTSINLSMYGKGLYALQLRSAEGFASKNISIE